MRKFDQINVIPLIDVMLVLLASVLITASFITLDKLDLSLPDAQHAANAEPSSVAALRISLDARGKLFIEEKPADLALLTKRLRQRPQRPVSLAVDRRCAFEHFVHVIDRIKAIDPPPPLTILARHADVP